MAERMSEDGTLSTGSGGARVNDTATEASNVAEHRYRVEDEVARGGAGRILRARDLALDRKVALKEPLDQRHGARLQREGRILAQLQHPSVIPIYDSGLHADGAPFYAMKLVEGRSLRDAIQATPDLEGRLGLIPSVIAVAEAVAYAHSLDIIHRDLKPGNVMLGADGETIVIDGGLAKYVGEAEPDQALVVAALD